MTAVVTLLLAILVPASARDNGAIILRLDEPGQQQTVTAPPSESAPQTAPGAETATPTDQATPSLDECPIIDVPAVADRPAPLPDVSKAGSAVIMDAETGQVLFAKNAHTRRPNASTTKIMTAILAIENVDMDTWITASKNASQTPYTSIHLKPGEKIRARDLLYGMLIRSANDAAVAFAEHIGGSVSKFAGMMNRKAKEIGCTDTHFVTPNGLYAKGHYSSAADLCLMARYAFRYPLFNQIINTRKYTLDSRTMNRKDLAVFARNKFMKDYPGADGVKSGYIKQAGYCYVGSATHDGWRLVAAVLKSDNSSRDTAAMMNYAFANFRPYTIARADAACAGVRITGGASDTVAAAPVRDMRVIVPRTGARIVAKLLPKSLEAPITKGTSVGKMTLMVNGKAVDTVELRAAEDVGISVARRVWRLIGGCGLLTAGLWGIKNGTALAKGTRRRRRGITAPLRGADRWR